MKAGHIAKVNTGEFPMSKIMPWIDELPEAAKTDFPARRDGIVAMLDEAAELVRKAEELRAKAYFTGCTLEGGGGSQGAGALVRNHGPASVGPLQRTPGRKFSDAQGQDRDSDCGSTVPPLR
jgi:hypothetical protein